MGAEIKKLLWRKEIKAWSDLKPRYFTHTHTYYYYCQCVWSLYGIIRNNGARKCHCRFASCGKVCSQMEKENPTNLHLQRTLVQTQLMSSIYRTCQAIYIEYVQCVKLK